MTPDQSLAIVDRLLELRRDIAGLARSVDVGSATFTIEWRAALEAIEARLVELASLEAFLEPVLAPPGCARFTVEQLRAWIVRMAERDEGGWTWPVDAPDTTPRLDRTIH
jgi:hypothetical protein